jgi:small subunit ribosomal protein S9
LKVVTAVGKRKTAIARAIVEEGNGRVRINKILLQAVQNPFMKSKIAEPLILLGERAREIQVDVRVKGGGEMGRAEAARSAIAKGLVDFFEDEELRKQMSDYDRALLVDDTRRKEPKHFGGRGARAKRQKSYR